ncbi:synaptotagmin-5-like, partial [Symsagittifera roscoffensis]|uniref:synaptotagmin-5-like n=1 Tax=Symsagittifera roscoffensis TaxID=84072 RepID=UPI00307B4B70
LEVCCDCRKVLVRVYRHFKFVRDAPIGDAVLSLSKTDLQLGFSSIPILAHNPSLDDPLGEISVTLRYNANTQKLGVTIIECKDLKPSFGGSTDPYVKLTMKMGNKIVRKDKSDELKKTRSPYFNEVFSYKIPPNKMGLVDLLIQVKNRDLFGSSHEIGAVRFGVEPDSEKAERQWEAMITHLRKPQTQWHYLLPSQN